MLAVDEAAAQAAGSLSGNEMLAVQFGRCGSSRCGMCSDCAGHATALTCIALFLILAEFLEM